MWRAYASGRESLVKDGNDLAQVAAVIIKKVRNPPAVEWELQPFSI